MTDEELRVECERLEREIEQARVTENLSDHARYGMVRRKHSLADIRRELANREAMMKVMMKPTETNPRRPR